MMKPLAKAGRVLGLGLGGFIDGIALHQILGWHHLVCTTETCQVATAEALKRQNTQDGFFHLGVWILTLAGVGLLFRVGRDLREEWRARTLGGAMLGGWGAFNFFEGLIDHHVLNLHHVRPGDPHELLWDVLFLLSGAALMIIGHLVGRSGRPLRDAQT